MVAGNNNILVEPKQRESEWRPVLPPLVYQSSHRATNLPESEWMLQLSAPKPRLNGFGQRRLGWQAASIRMFKWSIDGDQDVLCLRAGPLATRVARLANTYPSRQGVSRSHRHGRAALTSSGHADDGARHRARRVCCANRVSTHSADRLATRWLALKLDPQTNSI